MEKQDNMNKKELERLELARKTYDWEPKISLKDGLEKTINYFQEFLNL